MKDSIFEVRCPCCGSALEIDGSAEIVLSHQEPERPDKPKDLRKAVEQMREQESGRDEAFRKQFEAEKKHSDELDKKFAGLLKKQGGQKPTKPDWRDIDLD